MMLAALFFCSGCAVTQFDPSAPRDFDLVWNYGQPALSEQSFREFQAKAGGQSLDYRVELTTQLARTYSLRNQFTEAHALLDGLVPDLTQASPRAQARYLLERGRCYNSAGENERAIGLFEAALAAAQRAKADFYVVDAMHMLAIATRGDASLDWNRRALAIAEASQDRRTREWASRLLHNIGMTYHSQGRYDLALQYFESAIPLWRVQGATQREFEGRWMIGWTLRTMKRYDDALHLMQLLRQQMEAADQPDGYVYEELGENLLAKDQPSDATKWFAKAYAALKDDPAVRADPTRLARLRMLGGL